MADVNSTLAQLQGAQAAYNPNATLTQNQGNLDTAGAAQQVSGLRQAINTTTGLLNQVAPSVMGRIGNSLVNNAQANSQISSESAPLQAAQSAEKSAYDDASTNYNTLQGLASSAADTSNKGTQDQLTYLQNIYNDYLGQQQDSAASSYNKDQFNKQYAGYV